MGRAEAGTGRQRLLLPARSVHQGPGKARPEGRETVLLEPGKAVPWPRASGPALLPQASVLPLVRKDSDSTGAEQYSFRERMRGPRQIRHLPSGPPEALQGVCCKFSEQEWVEGRSEDVMEGIRLERAACGGRGGGDRARVMGKVKGAWDGHGGWNGARARGDIWGDLDFEFGATDQSKEGVGRRFGFAGRDNELGFGTSWGGSN